MNTNEEESIEKKYISHEIGSEYLEWEQRDDAGRGKIILITAPTGSGKSHFILYTFLKSVIEKEEKLLYFVNRRILKDQLFEELNKQVKREMINSFGKIINLNNYISIRTYQSLESDLKGREPEKAIYELEKYSYVVYDECHYFLADSNFNTNTELSYDCLRRSFDYKVQIFMSATMKNIEKFILEKPKYLRGYDENKIISVGDAYRIKRYSVPLKYDYIRLCSFGDMEDLIGIMSSKSEEKEKWLIFVDSIPFGEKLKNDLKNALGTDKKDFSEENIVLITAEYKKEEETRNIVQEIVEEYKSKRKIIISTEVMYNGVSFHDDDLVNIVIFADMEENFIQMLGRKRMNNRNVNLYLCKRNKTHFRKHLQQTEQIIDFYTSIKNNLENIYKRTVPNGEEIDSSPYTELFHITKEINDYKILKQNGFPDSESLPFAYYRNINCEQILFEQQPILDKILNNDYAYENAKKICYSVRGIISLNNFSIQKCVNQIIFYSDIIEKLEDDENAFLKMQAEWLGKSSDEIDAFIQYSNESTDERNRQKIKEIIEGTMKEDINTGEKIKGYLDRDITVVENKNMKLKLKKYLIHFLRNSEEYKSDMETYDKQITYLGRNDRIITPQSFNLCMKSARLPYKMSKPCDGRGYKGKDNEKEKKNIFKIVDASVSQDTLEN